MSVETRLREILTRYDKGVYVIDCIEISHSLLSQTYYFTRETGGVTATDGTSKDYVGCNFTIEMNTKTDDLDANFSFMLPDLDNILDDELDLIGYNNTENIVLRYVTFNSDDLTAPSSQADLSVMGVTQTKGAFSLSCGVPQLNWRETGIKYTVDIFPTMRAL